MECEQNDLRGEEGGGSERSERIWEALQSGLVESEKGRLIARLAAGVAHEIRNPLAVLRMGLEGLGGVGGGDPVVREALMQRMREAVERADGVVERLLHLALPPRVETEGVLLGQAVERAMRELEGEAVAHGVRLVLDVGEESVPPVVAVEAGMLVRALVELMRNAIQASPQGGVVRVAWGRERIAGFGGNVGGERIDRFRIGEIVGWVRVSDEGPGLSQREFALVFDPFYTTRPTGQGMGLGLTVGRAIIEMHGGAIALRNGVRGGLCATCYLKLLPAP